MGIYASLFSASITLAGFIAVFLVFRYRQIDTYVDSRKDILISSLLKNQIERAPCIAVRIQDIGNDPQTPDANSLCNCINKDLKKERLNKLNPQTEKAVKRFANDIYGYRIFRNFIVGLGLTSITIWTLFSIMCLIDIYLINNFRRCLIAFFILNKFIFSVLFTLSFVIISLIAKPKWFYQGEY